MFLCTCTHKTIATKIMKIFISLPNLSIILNPFQQIKQNCFQLLYISLFFLKLYMDKIILYRPIFFFRISCCNYFDTDQCSQILRTIFVWLSSTASCGYYHFVHLFIYSQIVGLFALQDRSKIVRNIQFSKLTPLAVFIEYTQLKHNEHHIARS